MESSLTKIFNKLKLLMQKYEGELTPKINTSEQYDLWSTKEIEVFGKKRKEVYFAGLVTQKDYISLHYLPIYANPQMKDAIPERLLKTLKTMSCFHISDLDDELSADIESLLAKGYAEYEKRGWV